MAIAAVGMLVPALFNRLVEGKAPVPEHRLSLSVAVVLMVDLRPEPDLQPQDPPRPLQSLARRRKTDAWRASGRGLERP